MTQITASRLGSSPITLDWSHLYRGSTYTNHEGKKLPLRLEPNENDVSEAWQTLKSRIDSGELGFYRSAIDESLSHFKETEDLIKSFVHTRSFKDILFLGIGGSALGPIALLSAMKDKMKDAPRFHFMENIDAFEWNSTLQSIQPDSTLVIVASKSGSTFETLAQFSVALSWLTESRWRSHLIILTDPEKGELREFVRKHGIHALPLPPSIGGRFSLFTPVGLVPGMISHLDMNQFQLGAKQVFDYCEKTPAERNAIFQIGALILKHGRSRHTQVFMPYSTRLRAFGDFFVQLWGESLGKDGKGFTPVAALGATDQHSLLQLLRDGPDDKVILFTSIDSVHDKGKSSSSLSARGSGIGANGGSASPSAEVPIPVHPQFFDARIYPTMRLLGGSSFHRLLNTELEATAKVMANRDRPFMRISLDELNERSVGAYAFFQFILTAFVGTMMQINPFDQPGVEEGKQYTKQMLEKQDPARMGSSDTGRMSQREQFESQFSTESWREERDQESRSRLRLHRESQ